MDREFPLDVTSPGPTQQVGRITFAPDQNRKPPLSGMARIEAAVRLTMPERFFLGSDNDGHWYIVPEAQRDAWETWLDTDPEEEPEAPAYAKAIGGSPHRVTFTDWRLA